MIWSVITFDVKTLLRTVHDSLPVNAYTNQFVDVCVLPFLMPIQGVLFSMIVPHSHTARATIDYLNHLNVNLGLRKVPILIENIWNELDKRLKQNKTVRHQNRTEASFRRVESFHVIPNRTALSSMRKRFQACLAVRGGHTSY